MDKKSNKMKLLNDCALNMRVRLQIAETCFLRVFFTLPP